MARNFYGSLHTKNLGDTDAPATPRQLTHGVIQHGEQWLAPERAGEPISYYGPESGVGLAVLRPAATGPARRRVGLGTGTIAAYGRPGDSVTGSTKSTRR